LRRPSKKPPQPPAPKAQFLKIHTEEEQAAGCNASTFAAFPTLMVLRPMAREVTRSNGAIARRRNSLKWVYQTSWA